MKVKDLLSKYVGEGFEIISEAYGAAYGELKLRVNMFGKDSLLTKQDRADIPKAILNLKVHSFNVKESGLTIVTNFVPKRQVTRITRCYDQFNDAVAELLFKTSWLKK